MTQYMSRGGGTTKIIMGTTIHFELGPKYRITYVDGTSKVFTVVGGPDPQVLFENGEEEGLVYFPDLG